MKLGRVDQGMLLVTLFLIGLGLVFIYSSSLIFALESYDDGLFFFRKQLVYGFFAIVTLVVIAFLPLEKIKMIGLIAWVIAVLGVVLTLFPQFAIKAGGANRWVRLPLGLRFEPGELLKVGYPFVLALAFQQFLNRPNRLKLLIYSPFLLLPILLVLKQPDFGTAVIVLSVIVTLLFIYGVSIKYFIGVAVLAIPAFYIFVVQVPYRWDRIQAFLDPWNNASDKGFQVVQSMLSFYSGGITGQGLGQAQGKLFFLPEAHTDFILSVFAEESGFIGVVFLILLYGFLVFRSFRVAALEQDRSTQILIFGLSIVLALSVFINMGVAMGLLPTKGLTLPFMSYGGSSLLCYSFAIGVILAADRRQRVLQTSRPRNFKYIPRN